ncbi:hypothetical protein Tco_1431942 [Tanacetum coccineum]
MGERSTLYCQGEELVLLVLPVVCLYCQWQLILVALSLKVGDASYPDLWIVVLRIGKLQGIREFSVQTAIGKESSNPFMAGNLPKTIHLCDSLQSDEDSFELIELMILCTNFLTMVRDSENLKNHSFNNEESLGEDASKQGRIDDANAEVTFIDKTSNDARTKNNKISNSKRWKMTKKQL